MSDAQDRYSNAETAYLLQRIEQYAGISVLATNLLQNFDEAFPKKNLLHGAFSYAGCFAQKGTVGRNLPG